MPHGSVLKPLQRRSRNSTRSLNVELCEERALLAVLDLMPSAAAGTISEENGITVITVVPDQVIDVSAELETAESPITGYQINFGMSDPSLVLANWIGNDTNFPLAIDSTLNHASNDRFVAAIAFTGVPAPPVAEIGTFQVTAPTAEGDYLLSLDFTTGGETENTILSDASANSLPITDFGDLIIRVMIPNEPPTITAIDDATIDEDTMTGDLAFTIGDAETDPASLVVTVSSDNQALIPDVNIVISGSGADRTVKVTPQADQNGSALITLIVSDGDKTAEETFTVNVTPVNDPPTVTPVNDVTIDEDTMTGDLAFEIGDLETAVESLIVSATSDNQLLVPDANIVISGTGANRTVKVTPLGDQNGSAVISLVVSDGDKTSQEAFTVNVTPTNDQPTSIQLSPTTLDENVDGAIVGTITVDDVDANDSYLYDLSDSRFEVVAGDLRLKSGNAIDFETEPEISITIRATDPGSLFVEDAFLLEVINKNDAPQVNQTLPDVNAEWGDPPQTVDLSSVFSDQDIASMGDALTLSVSQNSDPLVVTPTLDGSDLELVFSTTNIGTSLITIRATDSQNEFVETSFSVNVSLKSTVSVSISSLEDSRLVGNNQPVSLAPAVLNEWQTAVAGIWVTVGEEIPAGPFDLSVQLGWSSAWYATAEVIDVLGTDGTVQTTFDQGTATSDVSLTQIDLSAYAVGENVLVARVALNVDTSDPVGVAIGAAGAYPTLVSDIGITLNSAELVVEEVSLQTAPIAEVDLAPVIYDGDDSGHVGISDFAAFLNNYGKVVDGTNPGGYLFDYDQSGRVGIADFVLFIQYYGQRKPDDRFIDMPGLTSTVTAPSTSLPLEAESIADDTPLATELPITPAGEEALSQSTIVVPATVIGNKPVRLTEADESALASALRFDEAHSPKFYATDRIFQHYEHAIECEYELIEHDSTEELPFDDTLDESLVGIWEDD